MSKQDLQDLHRARAEQRGDVVSPMPPKAVKPRRPYQQRNRPAVYYPQPLQGMVTPTSLVLPFPLTSTRIAQLLIPRDMNQQEASRLCALVQSLAMPE